MFSIQLMLVVPLLLVGYSSADYQISIVVNRITFQPPMNTLSDGSCCNSTCGMNQTCCASTSCSPTLRLCFRESGHPREDTDSNCPILEIDRTNVNQQLVVFGIDNLPIPRYFSGNFQVYIRIAHSEDDTPDFVPPFTDPVIDNAFLEFSQLRAVSYADRLAPVNQLLTATGEFGLVTVQMQASVHCSRGWEGTACEFLNNTQVYSAPISTSSTNAPTSSTNAPTNSTNIPTSPTVGPSGGVAAESSDNNVLAIAVGVSVGVALFLLLAVIIIVIIVVVKRRKRRRTFTPKTPDFSYVVKAKQTEKTYSHTIPALEPKINHNALYAQVNKKRSGLQLY